MQSQNVFSSISDVTVNHFINFLSELNQEVIAEMCHQYPDILFHLSVRKELLKVLRSATYSNELLHLLAECGAFFIAIDENDQVVAEKLLESKINIRKKINNQSPLYLAITKNNQVIANRILQEENDVNFLIEEIFQTVSIGNLEILKLFIQRFPDILNHVNHSGNTIGAELLVVSVGNGRDTITEFLNKEHKIDLRHYNGVFSLILEKQSDPKKFEKLIELNADPSKLDPVSGLNILHYAVINNHSEVVKNLIESGINVNMTTSKGLTPMMFCQSQRMASVLFDSKIDLNIQDENKNTALTLATLIVSPERNMIARDIVNIFIKNLNTDGLKIEKRCRNMFESSKQMLPQQFNPFKTFFNLQFAQADQLNSKFLEVCGFYIISLIIPELSNMKQSAMDPVMLREMSTVYLDYANGLNQENIFENLKKLASKLHQCISMKEIREEECHSEKPSKLKKANEAKIIFDINLAMHRVLFFLERRFNNEDRIACWHLNYQLLAEILQKMELLTEEEKIKLKKVNLLENKSHELLPQTEIIERYRIAIPIILDKLELQFKKELEFTPHPLDDEKKVESPITISSFLTEENLLGINNPILLAIKAKPLKDITPFKLEQLKSIIENITDHFFINSDKQSCLLMINNFLKKHPSSSLFKPQKTSNEESTKSSRKRKKEEDNEQVVKKGK